MCPPWTEFEVDSLSGLVVGRASCGASTTAAGPAAATDQHDDVARYKDPQALMLC